MNKLLPRLYTAAQAARQLGLRQTGWYAVYQMGLRTGHYRRVTPPKAYEPYAGRLDSPFTLPSPGQFASLFTPEQSAQAVQEADEVLAGQVRLFGGPPAALRLAPGDVSQHWTFYEGRPASWGVEDIKFLWEPARFGWAYPLARAYALTGAEQYPACFWQYLDEFTAANPPNQGPNWSSAQEVALRLLALLFAAGVFRASVHSTPERRARLAGVLVAHARRIPPTLPYARAQNNNHLLSEALGLFAGGCALPDHPDAPSWRALGWQQFNAALLNQIHADGVYVQHSMNYHRLMLHLALQAALFGQPFPLAVQQRLAAGSRWLLAQVDPSSGRAPNLGSNDGANLLPLAPGGFRDYRATAQAAARTFLGQPGFEPGAWDELSLWLGQPTETGRAPLPPLPESEAVDRLGDPASWATLRAVRFRERPAHADQLHVDLWWHGINVALDAGTYRYTAPAPWDNALARTLVHNTITIDGQDQMRRAGRFLWLDWAQARKTASDGASITAQQDGFLRRGMLHRRSITRLSPDQWQVTDELLPGRAARALADYACTLHWLLPDGPWRVDGTRLTLSLPSGGEVSLTVEPGSEARLEDISLVRGGKALLGPGEVSPVRGWYSPTYGVKTPALSFAVTLRARLPLTITSRWTFISAEPQAAVQS